MGLNLVTNSAPGQVVAFQVDAYTSELNQPNPVAPPGASGVQTSAASGQLTRGNLGGIDVTAGIGITLDNVA
jgi:hypothetical protein